MQGRPMAPAMTPADLQPGDIGFGPIRGAAGVLVNLGQLILGEGFRVGTLDIRHVFVVTEAAHRTDHGWVRDPIMVPIEGHVAPQVFTAPKAVEAMPRGAREIGMAERWTREYAYVRLAEDYPGQAAGAAAIARAMIGTPYSFASYAALAAWRFGLKAERLEHWIDRRRPAVKVPGLFPRVMLMPGIQLPQEAICSVLADQAWSLAGKRIMHGVGRQCVTPGALALRLLEMASEGESAVWTFPGRPAWQP